MRHIAYRLAIVIMVPLLTAVPFVVNNAHAQIVSLGDRDIELSSSEVSAITSHQVSFGYVSAAAVGSFEVEYCANDPLPGNPCTPPAGLDVLGAVLSSESGETGFSIHPNTTVNRLVLSRAAAAPTVFDPTQSSYLFTNVTNPNSVGTFFARLSTFASTDGTGARIDEGGVAMSLNDPISIGVYVPPILIFCVGTSIPTNECTSATGDAIDFGNFSTAATAVGTTQMLVGTNAGPGYTVSVTGTTMTSGNNVIDAMNPRTTSQTNTSQFGINLRNNTVPNIGTDIAGAGVGFPLTDYNQPNQFKFQNSDTIARSNISTRVNKYTVSYVVNIDGDQSPGVYATTLTYTALAAF